VRGIPFRPIGIRSAPARASTKTVSPFTLPFLRACCGFRRLPGVEHSAPLGWTLESCRGGTGGRGTSPQGKALAGDGKETSTATVATHAAAAALARRLPLQAPRRGRTRGGILLITVYDGI
jgi:hypothetical protein